MFPVQIRVNIDEQHLNDVETAHRDLRSRSGEDLRQEKRGTEYRRRKMVRTHEFSQYESRCKGASAFRGVGYF
jgi:hypothetical protein